MLLAAPFEGPAAANRGRDWRHRISSASRLNRNSLCAPRQTIPEPTQKVRALTHEAPVGWFHAVDQADHLRHHEREQRQREHRNK